MDEKIERERSKQAYTGESQGSTPFEGLPQEGGGRKISPGSAKLFQHDHLFRGERHRERTLRVLREMTNTRRKPQGGLQESERDVARVAYNPDSSVLPLDLGGGGSAARFTASRDVEGSHAGSSPRVRLNDLIGDQVTDYYICTVCGGVSVASVPMFLPVCGGESLRGGGEEPCGGERRRARARKAAQERRGKGRDADMIDLVKRLLEGEETSIERPRPPHGRA